MKQYIVKNGDTLSKIAKQFETSVDAIQKANATIIKDVNKISVGWKLSIPVSEGSEKRFEAIGRAFEECWQDIENLDSYQRLMELIE